MKVVDREALAREWHRGWIECWREQKGATSVREIGEKFAQVPVGEVTAALLTSIAGHSGWTRTECHDCGAVDVNVVEMGQPPDYDSCTANICELCLRRALALIEVHP
jgi:hypothetical protein